MRYSGLEGLCEYEKPIVKLPSASDVDPHIFSVWVAAHPAARLPGAEIIRRFPLILLLLITIGILFDLLISTVLNLGKRKTV